MRPLRLLAPFAALCLGLSACSLLVDFDEEDQPCDDRNQCLDGFVCKDDSCVRSGDSSPADGGGNPDSGPGPGIPTDGGTPDSGVPDSGVQGGGP